MATLKPQRSKNATDQKEEDENVALTPKKTLLDEQKSPQVSRSTNTFVSHVRYTLLKRKYELNFDVKCVISLLSVLLGLYIHVFTDSSTKVFLSCLHRTILPRRRT